MKYISDDDKIRIKKFEGMSNEEFDNYMLNVYPELFRDRHKPMQETCMCWGFEIPCGWYWGLDKLCEDLNEIRLNLGITTVFDQIKQKFSTSRFYYHVEIDNELSDQGNKLIKDLISHKVSCAESLCDSCDVLTGYPLEYNETVYHRYSSYGIETFKKLGNITKEDIKSAEESLEKRKLCRKISDTVRYSNLSKERMEEILELISEKEG